MLHIVCKAERDCGARENAWQVTVPGKLAHAFRFKCFKSIKKNSVLGHGNTNDWITKKALLILFSAWGALAPFEKQSARLGWAEHLLPPAASLERYTRCPKWRSEQSPWAHTDNTKLRCDPLVCSDVGVAAPNPCIKHCSRKCEIISCALFKLREIKASQLKETLSAPTAGLCPKLRCPSPLRWDLGHSIDNFCKIGPRETRGKWRGDSEQNSDPAESSSGTNNSTAMMLLSRAVYCRWAWVALSHPKYGVDIHRERQGIINNSLFSKPYSFPQVSCTSLFCLQWISFTAMKGIREFCCQGQMPLGLTRLCGLWQTVLCESQQMLWLATFFTSCLAQRKSIFDSSANSVLRHNRLLLHCSLRS